MGKRELLIIAAFAVIGVVAYQLTAPPAKDGQGFSFSRLWQNTKRSVRGNAPIATHVSTGVIPAGAALKQLRVGGFSRGLRIQGENRSDIAYEMTVGSSGPDEATAMAWAKRTQIARDELDESLGLRVNAPREGSQFTSIVLKVPARLSVRIDGAVGSVPGGTGGAVISGVSGLELDGTGSVRVEHVRGAITGAHAQGDLTVAGAGSVDLRLDGSRAKFSGVTGGVTITGRQARFEIADSGGPLDVSGSGVTTSVTGHAGPIRITGSNGRVTVDGPREETRIDVRRAEVQVTLRTPVALTILTSDQIVRLMIDGNPDVTLDAIATETGTITATDFTLTPAAADREQRLSHTFGGGAAARRVTIRNLRGQIVIGRAK
jgi:hypothetical protein